MDAMTIMKFIGVASLWLSILPFGGIAVAEPVGQGISTTSACEAACKKCPVNKAMLTNNTSMTAQACADCADCYIRSLRSAPLQTPSGTPLQAPSGAPSQTKQ